MKIPCAVLPCSSQAEELLRCLSCDCVFLPATEGATLVMQVVLKADPAWWYPHLKAHPTPRAAAPALACDFADASMSVTMMMGSLDMHVVLQSVEAQVRHRCLCTDWEVLGAVGVSGVLHQEVMYCWQPG